jgi:hypothetical protein
MQKKNNNNNKSEIRNYCSVFISIINKVVCVFNYKRKFKLGGIVEICYLILSTSLENLDSQFAISYIYVKTRLQIQANSHPMEKIVILGLH